MKHLVKIITIVFISSLQQSLTLQKSANEEVIDFVKSEENKTKNKILMLGVRDNEEKFKKENYNLGVDKDWLCVSLDQAERTQSSYKLSKNHVHFKGDFETAEVQEKFKNLFKIVLLDVGVVKNIQYSNIIDFELRGAIKFFAKPEGKVIIPLNIYSICFSSNKKLEFYPSISIPDFIQSQEKICNVIQPKLKQLRRLKIIQEASRHFKDIKLIENTKYPFSLTEEKDSYLIMSHKRQRLLNPSINNEEKIYRIKYEIDEFLETQYHHTSELWYRLTREEKKSKYKKGPAPTKALEKTNNDESNKTNFLYYGLGGIAIVGVIFTLMCMKKKNAKKRSASPQGFLSHSA